MITWSSVIEVVEKDDFNSNIYVWIHLLGVCIFPFHAIRYASRYIESEKKWFESKNLSFET